mgnify:FL=1
MDNDPYLRILNEIKSLRRDMKELNDKLDRHISFIESVYRWLRNTIDRVKNWFGGWHTNANVV